MLTYDIGDMVNVYIRVVRLINKIKCCRTLKTMHIVQYAVMRVARRLLDVVRVAM
jgi:hypothetical protein